MLSLLAQELTADMVAEAPKPQYGGTLHLGWYHKPAPFDPFNTTDSISMPLLGVIFNRLVRFNAVGDLEPDLAERWEISEDGLTYTFYLRPEIYFHDGTLCTTKDVLASFEWASDQALSPALSKYFTIVRQWRAVSDSVFQVTLKEPSAPFLRNLWRVYIVPQHRLGNAKKNLEAFAQHPVGTGPFALEEYEPETGRMRFKANDHYFEGRPYLNEMTMEIFPSKERLWAAFLRDKIDVLFYLNRPDYEAIQDNPAFHVFHMLPQGGYALIFNTRDPVLANVQIRAALSYGINRREIVDRIENGQGALIDGPFHPGSWAYDRTRPLNGYDPAKSQALFSAEGFQLNNGILERHGERLVLDLLVDSGNETLIRMAKLIRQQLQELGVMIQLSYFSGQEELTKRVYQKDATFQCYLFAFSTGMDPDIASRYWTSSGTFNWGGYRSAQVDKLFSQARKTQNQLERKFFYQEIQSLLAVEKPAVFLHIPYAFHAVSEKIGNYQKLASPYVLFYQLKDVYKKSE